MNPPGTRGAGAGAARLAAWLPCLAALAASTLAPGWARGPWVQWAPWAVGLVLLGIPHGALDHDVGRRLMAPGSGRAPARFFAGYLGAMGAVGLLWLAWPLGALALFLAAAALHFGEADVAWSRESGLLARVDAPGYAPALLAARAALPVALPALASPAEFAAEADAIVRGLFPGRSGWSVHGPLAAAGVAATLALAILQVGWALRVGRRAPGPAIEEAAETALLAGLFLVAPPVLAVGVYFNAWHAFRHVARLDRMAAEDAPAATGPGPRPGTLGALARFHGRALPMTAATLVLLAGLGLAFGDLLAGLGPADLGPLALVLISVLTVPHALLVAWLDARRGVWPARAGGAP